MLNKLWELFISTFTSSEKKLNVALTYNIKQESFDIPSAKYPFLKKFNYNANISQDTFAEWDTEETINAVRDALAIYHNVTLVEADNDAFETFRELNPDIVFNIAEGFNGISREAQIPAMLEFLNIPYTGSDPVTLGICLDKSRTKEILSFYKIPTPKFLLIEKEEDFNSFDFPLPAIVKPVAEGSSKGIFNSSVVRTREELIKEIQRVHNVYNQSALVEEFLEGREFTVAILGNGKDARVLPIIEMKFEELPEGVLPIYSYEAKWIFDTREDPLDIYECPANINEKLKSEIEKIALLTYRVLRCRDWSRIDIRLDENEVPNVLEINPLPGILPDPKDNSCYPKAARAAGMTYVEMINAVLNEARKRYGLWKRTLRYY